MSSFVGAPAESKLAPAQEERQQRLKRIVRKGLPPFPQVALELTKVLGGASPDVQRAGKLISTDAMLSSQVLRICNSPMLGLRSRVINIQQAAVLLGAERLRNLALTGSMVEFTSGALPESAMNTFWQHSLTAAMLSQYLARQRKFFEKDQAYFAGLLHDIGQIPQWILSIEDKDKSEAFYPGDYSDNTIEREYFGTDHCALGFSMAGFWDLLPSLGDVIENHHTPETAKHDSILVRIVATVEYFLLLKDQSIPAPSEDFPPLAENVELFEIFQNLGRELYGEIEWPSVEHRWKTNTFESYLSSRRACKVFSPGTIRNPNRHSVHRENSAAMDAKCEVFSILPSVQFGLKALSA